MSDKPIDEAVIQAMVTSMTTLQEKPLPAAQSKKPPAHFPLDWQVDLRSGGQGQTVLQSSYGIHDEQLVLNGDFESVSQREEYAQRLAAILNTFWSQSQPEGHEPFVFPGADYVAVPRALFKTVLNMLERDAEKGQVVRWETRQALLDESLQGRS